MHNNPKIKVLVVDDSALIRSSLTEIISSFPEFEVIGTAADPYIAVHKMKENKPDVITLDIQMPKMDGLTFLRKIMNQHPIPVVVVSSLTSKDSDIALEAYKSGAISVLEKPVFISELKHNEWKDHFLESLFAAYNSKISKNNTLKTKVNEDLGKTKTKPRNKQTCNSFILIGASAGGTEVVNTILSHLDSDCAPILIVQHMPPQFTPSFAARLNANSNITVKQAQSGDELERGTALIAPGDMHMELRNNGFNYFVKLTDSEKVNRHRPSVDVLFNSAKQFTGPKKMGIVLSGMGKDGAEGLLELKKSSAITIAQDQNSCIVYGMPKEALKIGAASYSMDIDQIIRTIKDFSTTNS
jgi:two-component system chemotaxis response regulator CheB